MSIKISLSLSAGRSGKLFLGKGGGDGTNRNSSRDSLEIGGTGGGDWERSRTSLERVGATLPFSESKVPSFATLRDFLSEFLSSVKIGEFQIA